MCINYCCDTAQYSETVWCGVIKCWLFALSTSCINASFWILKDTTNYFQNSLDVKNKNLILLLIKYEYNNFCFFSSDLFLFPKIFVSKQKEVTGSQRKLHNDLLLLLLLTK
jgi:hypothetical protein